MMMNIIKQRSGKLLGHLYMHNICLTNVIEGCIDGCKESGLPKETFKTKIIKLADCENYSDIKRLADRGGE